jgi:hypothetical protein
MDRERCPRCTGARHIVRVKFRLTGTTLTYACPRCENADQHDAANGELKSGQQSAGLDVAA